jgi:hypothetical protein
MTLVRLSLAAALAAPMLAAPFVVEPARASDIRPIGYLERGTLQPSETGPTFVPDSATNATGGRYFRLGGLDETAFYGLGTNPGFDWFWPSYHTQSRLREVLRVSPGATNYLDRYEQAQEYTQNWARIGVMVTVGSVLTAVGGLAYSLIPSNPREMAPGFYFATGGAAAAGLALWGGSSVVASDNQGLLDRAIQNYNRDMAGRRKTQ